MTMETIAGQFGSGGSKLGSQKAGGLKAILKELQGLRFSVVQGVNTGIMLFPGIRTTDTILAVLAFDGDGSAANSLIDVTSNVTVPVMHKLTCDNDLSSYRLLVIWYDKDDAAATTTTTTTTSTTTTTTTSSSTTTTTTSSTTTTTTTTAP